MFKKRSHFKLLSLLGISLLTSVGVVGGISVTSKGVEKVSAASTTKNTIRIYFEDQVGWTSMGNDPVIYVEVNDFVEGSGWTSIPEDIADVIPDFSVRYISSYQFEMTGNWCDEGNNRHYEFIFPWFIDNISVYKFHLGSHWLDFFEGSTNDNKHKRDYLYSDSSGWHISSTVDSSGHTNSVDQYTITYKDGSTTVGTDANVLMYTYYSTKNYDVDGKTFDGWYTDSSFTSPYTVRRITSDTTLYGKYTANTYAINYKPGQYGTGSQESTSKTHGVNLTLPGVKFTRTGYTQDGWSTTDGGTKAFDLNGVYTTNAAQDFYPHWSASSYTVTLDPKGGTGGSTSVTATYGANMPSATMPTKVGYNFNGYYDAEIDGNQYYTSTGASARTWDRARSDIILYARWTPKTYTVGLDNQGGTGGFSSVSDVTYNATMPTISTLPSKGGYNFDGYYSATGGNGTKYYNSDGTSAHVWDIDVASPVLYANWIEQSQVTITFIVLGNTYATRTGVPGSTYVEPDDPEIGGYTFKGWDTSLPEVIPNSNLTITANMEANTYTVTYVTNYGIAPSQQNVTYNSSFTVASMSAVTGYTFNHWSGSDGKTYSAGATVTYSVVGNLTLTASWTTNEHTLSWDFDGGTTTSTSYTKGTVQFGATITAPAEPTKQGYIFDGWLINGDSGTVPSTMPDIDLTILATWRENTAPFVLRGTYTTTHWSDVGAAEFINDDALGCYKITGLHLKANDEVLASKGGDYYRIDEGWAPYCPFNIGDAKYIEKVSHEDGSVNIKILVESDYDIFFDGNGKYILVPGPLQATFGDGNRMLASIHHVYFDDTHTESQDQVINILRLEYQIEDQDVVRGEVVAFYIDGSTTPLTAYEDKASTNNIVNTRGTLAFHNDAEDVDTFLKFYKEMIENNSHARVYASERTPLSVTGGENFYIQNLSTDFWLADNAEVYGYFFDDKGNNAWSTKAIEIKNEKGGTGTYEITVPGSNTQTWTTVIFVRMNPNRSGEPAGWNYVWEQTDNISLTTAPDYYRSFTVPEGRHWSDAQQKTVLDGDHTNLGNNYNDLDSWNSYRAFFNKECEFCGTHSGSHLTEIQAVWSELKAQYEAMSAFNREKFTNSTVDPTKEGGNIGRIVALYDYIIMKYGTQIDANPDFAHRFTDENGEFMLPQNANRSWKLSESEDQTILIVVIASASLLTLSAGALAILLKKKKKHTND